MWDVFFLFSPSYHALALALAYSVLYLRQTQGTALPVMVPALFVRASRCCWRRINASVPNDTHVHANSSSIFFYLSKTGVLFSLIVHMQKRAAHLLSQTKSTQITRAMNIIVTYREPSINSPPDHPRAPTPMTSTLLNRVTTKVVVVRAPQALDKARHQNAFGRLGSLMIDTTQFQSIWFERNRWNDSQWGSHKRPPGWLQPSRGPLGVFFTLLPADH
jgi:hypothetical protein